MVSLGVRLNLCHPARKRSFKASLRTDSCRLAVVESQSCSALQIVRHTNLRHEAEFRPNFGNWRPHHCAPLPIAFPPS